MNWHMITASEIQHLSVPERFFEYAHAYRNAANALCVEMTTGGNSCTWPNGAVVLLLAAHATELFIKGAILFRKPGMDMEHHRIDELSDEYKKHYPESSFEWDIPFKTKYLGIAESEIEVLKKQPLLLAFFTAIRSRRVEKNGMVFFVLSLIHF